MEQVAEMEQGACEAPVKCGPYEAAALEDFERQVTEFVGLMQQSATASAQRVVCCSMAQPVGDALTGRDHAGRPGLVDALGDVAETMRHGGSVGIDFSPVRPAGAVIDGISVGASGALSFADLFDQVTGLVPTRIAQSARHLAMLRIDHPDIEEFIARSPNSFSIAVGVSGEFMHALDANAEVALVHAASPGGAEAASLKRCGDGKNRYVYGSVKARRIWNHTLQRGAERGDLQLVFVDRVADGNNLWYCEPTLVCDARGALFAPYGSSPLAGVRADMCVDQPFTSQATFNVERFKLMTRVAVAVLDGQLDATAWPLAQQEHEAITKRRVGVGLLGLPDALSMLGLAEDPSAARFFALNTAKAMRDEAYRASVALARELGPFPLFHAEKYLAQGSFAACLPGEITEGIKTHGVRNSHLLTLLPAWASQVAAAPAAQVPPGVELVGQTEAGVVPHPQIARAGTGLQVQLAAALAHYVDACAPVTLHLPMSATQTEVDGAYVQAYRAGLKAVRVRRTVARLARASK